MNEEMEKKVWKEIKREINKENERQRQKIFHDFIIKGGARLS